MFVFQPHAVDQFRCTYWTINNLTNAQPLTTSYGQHATSIGPDHICRQVLAKGIRSRHKGRRNHWAQLWPTLLSRSRWDENQEQSTGTVLLNTDTLLHFYLTHQPSARWVHGWWTALPLGLLCWKKSILDSMDCLTSWTPVLKEVNLRLDGLPYLLDSCAERSQS